MRRILKRVLTPPLLIAAALFFLFEGLLWRLAGIYAWLGKLPVLRTVERRIRELPPYGALVLFATPAICIAPIKFLALYWAAGGRPALGITTILAAKIAGTALVARIYELTRPALVSLNWFAWGEQKILSLRAMAYDWWRSTAFGRWTTMRWQAALAGFRRLRERWRSRGSHWIARRWTAIRQRLQPRPQSP